MVKDRIVLALVNEFKHVGRLSFVSKRPKTWQKWLSAARLCVEPTFSFGRPVAIQAVTGVSVVKPGGEFLFMERRAQGCTLEFPRRRERLALHQL